MSVKRKKKSSEKLVCRVTSVIGHTISGNDNTRLYQVKAKDLHQNPGKIGIFSRELFDEEYQNETYMLDLYDDDNPFSGFLANMRNIFPFYSDFSVFFMYIGMALFTK